MDMKELAKQYRDGAAACRERAAELAKALGDHAASGSETMALRRRISILRTMAAETASTARYLENYYERKDNDEQRDKETELGISEVEKLCDALGRGRRRQNANRGRGNRAKPDTQAEGAGEALLHMPDADEGHRGGNGHKSLHRVKKPEKRPGEAEYMHVAGGRGRGAARLKRG